MANIGAYNGNWRYGYYSQYQRVPNYDQENALFWKDRANEELVKLMDLIGDDQARALTNEITGTWKAVYEAIKDLVSKNTK